MKREKLKGAAELAAKVGRVFVATADAAGLPHLAAAGKLTLRPDGRVAVAAWFCPGTVVNVDQNPRVSLVVWDPAGGDGCQLLGRVEKVEEVGVLDGYAPAVERGRPLPQVERQLVVRVEKVLSFTPAPHTDEEA